MRARITSTVDLDSTPPSTTVAGSADDIGAFVARFLTAFADRLR